MSFGCVACLSFCEPSNSLFSTAPAGVMFDTPQDIVRHLPSIIIQSVQSKVMPPDNITQMTDEERALIESGRCKRA